MTMHFQHIWINGMLYLVPIFDDDEYERRREAIRQLYRWHRMEKRK